MRQRIYTAEELEMSGRSILQVSHSSLRHCQGPLAAPRPALSDRRETPSLSGSAFLLELGHGADDLEHQPARRRAQVLLEVFRPLLRSLKDSLLLIYPHDQVEIGGNSTFQILGKKFLD